jgi:hypothetical protein
MTLGGGAQNLGSLTGNSRDDIHEENIFTTQGTVLGKMLMQELTLFLCSCYKCFLQLLFLPRMFLQLCPSDTFYWDKCS